MAYIYYVGNTRNTEGYIGQASDLDYRRIKKHYKAALSNDYSDGAARLMIDYGINNVQGAIYNAPFYGIPKQVYEKFFDVGQVDGYTSYTQCCGDVNVMLDLAELFHITYAQMHGKSGAHYNKLGGGFQHTSALILKGANYQLSKFKLKIYEAPKSGQRLVNPLSYQQILTILPAIERFIGSTKIGDALMDSSTIRNYIKEVILEQATKRIYQGFHLKTDLAYDKTLDVSKYNTKLKELIEKTLQNTNSRFYKDLKAELKKEFGSIPDRIDGLRFTLSNMTAEEQNLLLQPLYDRIDSITGNTGQNIIRDIEKSIGGLQTTIPPVLSRYISKRRTNTGTSQQDITTLHLKHNAAVTFKQIRSTGDDGAQLLYNSQLGPIATNAVNNNSDAAALKLYVSQQICDSFFKHMDSFTFLNPLTVGNDSEKGLLSRLKESLANDYPVLSFQGSGDKNDEFAHALLSLGHQTKYPTGTVVNDTFIKNPKYDWNIMGTMSMGYRGNDHTWTYIRQKYDGIIITENQAAEELLNYIQLPITIITGKD